MDINNVILQGRLTRDADLKYTPNGVAVTSFAIACSRIKKAGENSAKADFVNCKIFGEKSEKLQRFLTKGRQVFLQGRLQIDNYEDHGQHKSYTQIVVSQLNFIWEEKDKNGSEKTNSAVPSNQQNHNSGRRQYLVDPGEDFDDIPF